MNRPCASKRSFQRACFVVMATLLATSALADTTDISPNQVKRVFRAEKTPLETHIVRPTSVDPVPSGTDITLQSGEFLAVRLDEKPRRIRVDGPRANLRDLRIQLPFGILDPGDTGDPVLLRAEVIVDGGGLAPVGDSFEGSLRLGLTDQRDSSSRVTLDPPIQILVSASPASVSPGDFEIARTNSYAQISVATDLAPREVMVAIRPSFVDHPIDIAIPVLSRIVLTASPQRIQGFGLASSRISVAVKPAPPNPVLVRLSSDKGQPDPPSLTIADGAAAYVELRSAGLGAATLAAEADMALDGTVDLDFVFPVAFLGASLLGGILGALLRVLLVRRKKPDTKIPPHVTTGVIVGLFVAVLGTLGINVLGISFGATYGEGLYFILAGLGGLGGSQLLKIGNLEPAIP